MYIYIPTHTESQLFEYLDPLLFADFVDPAHDSYDRGVQSLNPISHILSSVAVEHYSRRVSRSSCSPSRQLRFIANVPSPFSRPFIHLPLQFRSSCKQHLSVVRRKSVPTSWSGIRPEYYV